MRNSNKDDTQLILDEEIVVKNANLVLATDGASTG